MYIPELDALIFLATEFLGGGDDQPRLQVGIKALYEAAGITYVLPLLLRVVLPYLTWQPAPLQASGAILETNQSAARCLTDLAGGHASNFSNSWGCHSRSASKHVCHDLTLS